MDLSATLSQWVFHQIDFGHSQEATLTNIEFLMRATLCLKLTFKINPLVLLLPTQMRFGFKLRSLRILETYRPLRNCIDILTWIDISRATKLKTNNSCNAYSQLHVISCIKYCERKLIAHRIQTLVPDTQRTYDVPKSICLNLVLSIYVCIGMWCVCCI